MKEEEEEEEHTRQKQKNNFYRQKRQNKRLKVPVGLFSHHHEHLTFSSLLQSQMTNVSSSVNT